MLSIKVLHLENNVKNSDWFSKNDLYIKIIYGSEIRRTTVKWDKYMPVWNEQFLFNIDKRVEDVVFEICDSDKWSSDELLEKYVYSIDYKNMELEKKQVGKIAIEIGDIFDSYKNKIIILKEQCKKGNEHKNAIKKIQQFITNHMSVLN
jgi:Ca2+-dependent lipid-binding protein